MDIHVDVLLVAIACILNTVGFLVHLQWWHRAPKHHDPVPMPKTPDPGRHGR